MFRGAAEDYWAQRLIVDAVTPETLKLTPAQVRERLGIVEGPAHRMTMSNALADVQLTAAGQMFETAEADMRGIATKVWKNCPPSLGDILLLSRGHGAQSSSSTRTSASPSRSTSGPPPTWPGFCGRPLRRRKRRPGRDRHAQLPGMVGGVLGGRRRRGGGRAAQRLVDGRGARVRAGRLGDQGRVLRTTSGPSGSAGLRRT